MIVNFQNIAIWGDKEDTDLLESFSKYLNLELQFVKNDEQIRDGKTEIIEMLTKNVRKTKILLIVISFN